ncbi:MAG: hypothetical protein QM757_34750 [Paludibaculum sp.]
MSRSQRRLPRGSQSPLSSLERRRHRDLIEESKRGAIERLSGRLAHVANNLLMIIGGYAEELDGKPPS